MAVERRAAAVHYVLTGKRLAAYVIVAVMRQGVGRGAARVCHEITLLRGIPYGAGLLLRHVFGFRNRAGKRIDTGVGLVCRQVVGDIGDIICDFAD